MSNEAGKILLAILHGKPIPSSQRRHRTPFSGFQDPFAGDPYIKSNHHPLPFFRVPQAPSHLQNSQHSHQHQHHCPHQPSLQAFHPHSGSSNSFPISQRSTGYDVNYSKPTRRYTRETMLSYADSDTSRRIPRRLELAFEMYPSIRRKRFGDLMNPYYYDPASAYSLGPTQLWDSELQQWVVMGHK
ncbi:unnamed protein product [Lepeophtheirus salmonis]|uniref:(salmon louse) hypothetical protein n=1 Tax=Lepeophtheirus salmonis TaxID=72036 RepID=A0A7R8CFU5_LEPSM|nr:unnamed protein product [Lepeophtheirus salmonis]CAF2809727.1 unnamed protein product [Lepeophtheirus salmonis]